MQFFRGWSEQRIQEYFIWASHVIHGLKGSNAALEIQLEQVLALRGVQISPPQE